MSRGRRGASSEVSSTISPTLLLSDMSKLLDLDLYTDVFPLARALIYTRKAKLIDVVRNLKSIYYPTSCPNIACALCRTAASPIDLLTD
ncbi:hypothetical protein CALVIDRAFT_34924 [Calocera viscosa TUFC12733]|uniref:Uncharacterized protein n=1 Tax=Calocera viscosa (strain TUFC12733) TaxID=1330018 RepID=A0A167FMY0_CALVF|nr:hypothetical protein CALVIDRAFT_34924 [Calocera viscosa TUFC12733]